MSKLVENPRDNRFIRRRIVTCDEKWIYINNRDKQILRLNRGWQIAVVSGVIGLLLPGDEKWIFYRNAANRENVWIKPAAQPTTVQVAKQDRFAPKVMLCVWWNF